MIAKKNGKVAAAKATKDSSEAYREKSVKDIKAAQANDAASTGWTMHFPTRSASLFFRTLTRLWTLASLFYY